MRGPPVSRPRPAFTGSGMRPTELDLGEVSTSNPLPGGIGMGQLMHLAWYIRAAISVVSAGIFSWISVGLVIVLMMEKVSRAATPGSPRQSFTNFRVDQWETSLLSDRLRKAQPM